MKSLGQKDFAGTRLLRKGDWAVCFGSDWCGFCHVFRKLYEKLEGSAPFQVGWGDVTEEDSPLWDDFALDIIPTLMAFRDGEMIWRKDGVLMRGLDQQAIAQLLHVFGGGSRGG